MIVMACHFPILTAEKKLLHKSAAHARLLVAGANFGKVSRARINTADVDAHRALQERLTWWQAYLPASQSGVPTAIWKKNVAGSVALLLVHVVYVHRAEASRWTVFVFLARRQAMPGAGRWELSALSAIGAVQRRLTWIEKIRTLWRLADTILTFKASRTLPALNSQFAAAFSKHK